MHDKVVEMGSFIWFKPLGFAQVGKLSNAVSAHFWQFSSEIPRFSKAFRIPNREPEYTGIRPFTVDFPVIAGPVKVADVNFENKEIYKRRDIELAGDILIIGGIGEVVAAYVIEQAVPGSRCRRL